MTQGSHEISYLESGTICHDKITISQYTSKLRLQTSQVANQEGAYLRFLLHEATRSVSTSLWMGC